MRITLAAVALLALTATGCGSVGSVEPAAPPLDAESRAVDEIRAAVDTLASDPERFGERWPDIEARVDEILEADTEAPDDDPCDTAEIREALAASVVDWRIVASRLRVGDGGDDVERRIETAGLQMARAMVHIGSAPETCTTPEG